MRVEFITPHAFARDPASGAGNCWCGRPKDARSHTLRAWLRRRMREWWA